MSVAEVTIAGIDASLKERKGDPVKAELDIAMKRPRQMATPLEFEALEECSRHWTLNSEDRLYKRVLKREQSCRCGNPHGWGPGVHGGYPCLHIGKLLCRGWSNYGCAKTVTQPVRTTRGNAVRGFVEQYNAQWIVEKNGYLSPA